MVVYCHHGTRSEQARAYLAVNGWPDARNLTGGIDAYARDVDPSLPRYRAGAVRPEPAERIADQHDADHQDDDELTRLELRSIQVRMRLRIVPARSGAANTTTTGTATVEHSDHHVDAGDHQRFGHRGAGWR